MDALTITPAVVADAGRLTDLARASRAYRGVYAEALATVEVTADYVAANPLFLATNSEAVLLGFYSLIVDPPELDMLFVADAVQKRGVGRLLVAHMLDEARRLRLPGVRVVSHPPAEEFYRRMGARWIGTVPAKPPLVSWDRPQLWFGLATS